jgi:peroxiredoxin
LDGRLAGDGDPQPDRTSFELNQEEHMNLKRNARFQELEQRFSELESKMEDSPEKEAISILHAMLHESRYQAGGEAPLEEGVSLEVIANLYKTSPPMEGTAENEGLPTGAQAPDFSLPDANGKLVRLSDYRGRNVLLVFYPLDWSPGCSDQLSLYQSELQEIEGYNTQVIGISVDSIYSHGAWAAVRAIAFPLLADFHPKGEVARRYGVMRTSDGFSERALFLIDGEGIIRYQHVSPQLHRIPDIYELIDQLKRLENRGEPVTGGTQR